MIELTYPEPHCVIAITITPCTLWRFNDFKESRANHEAILLTAYSSFKPLPCSCIDVALIL